LPKVVLHDHLDGGLRVETLWELAEQAGHRLPGEDPAAVGDWIADAAAAGSLAAYLATFEHTLAVMQTAESLARVAREAVLDLADDGVAYAELRFAPEQHGRAGMTLDQAIDAVLAGLGEGEAEAAAQGCHITARAITCAMRQADRSLEVAEAALRFRGRGVVGFDIAGPEAGFPPRRHAAAFALLREAEFPFTIHAGEADGVESIREAVEEMGAARVGHGVRIIEDISGIGPGAGVGVRFGQLSGSGRRFGGLSRVGDGVEVRSGTLTEPGVDTEPAVLGPVASLLLTRGIALEMCPTSNLHTGAASSIDTHPISALKRLGFAVTLNTDNRLMSDTTMSREITLLLVEANWSMLDFKDVAITAAHAAFLPPDERQDLVARITAAY